jgi:hypothetical protein
MTSLEISRYVSCPERYGNMIDVDWCDQCEFKNILKSTDEIIVCECEDEGE